MMGRTWVVRPVLDEDWEHFRDLRLEMLADSPKAYLETAEAARQQTTDQWKARAAATFSDQACGYVAVDRGGRWIGIMRARVEDGTVYLLGVYVSPAWRASGIADELLTGVEEWVRGHGHNELVLEVHEDNSRAQAFYRRRGFVPTGAVVPYPLEPSESEIVMSKRL